MWMQKYIRAMPNTLHLRKQPSVLLLTGHLPILPWIPSVLNSSIQNRNHRQHHVSGMVSILPQKDRVAYATVNGQTGLVVTDIPIDPKRYLLGSLLLAIPIFALLAWSAFLQPSSLVMTTLLLSLLSIGVYCYECVSIHQKDTGANDRGKMFIQSKKASAADKPKTPEAQPKPAAKTNPLGWILPLCAAVLSFGIWFLHPVSDLYYYGAAILSMAAILVSFISIIHAYNLLSTRRLPQFDKQGGDDRA